MLSYFAVPGIDGWWKSSAIPAGCIKIGETSQPHRRRLDLRVVFLAFDSTPERELHRMFAAERMARHEYFYASSRLLDYIEQRVALLWGDYLEMGHSQDDARARLSELRECRALDQLYPLSNRATVRKSRQRSSGYGLAA